MDKRIKLGISACLLGEKVRYDGGHKLDRHLKETLGRFVDYVPVCPEAEAGFGIPREPMRLMGSPASPRLVTLNAQIDHTGKLLAWSREKLDELEKEGLCGFIFKSRSPSCGVGTTDVYREDGVLQAGTGIFAAAFVERFPMTPVADEDILHDPEHLNDFWGRVNAFKPAT